MAISSEECLFQFQRVLQYKQKRGYMNQEIADFEYFKNHQLVSVDFSTGTITAKGGRWGSHIYHDVGSVNPDGYVRLWCNKSLRMKHRLIFYLAHGVLPKAGEELDHIDKVRSNNALSNLCIASKRVNNIGSLNRKIGRFKPEEIHEICRLLQDTDLSDEDIAEQTKATRATVRDIKVRRSRQSISSSYSWKHRGY